MNTIPEEFARLLGKVSDRELSKRSGISPYYLKLARQAEGIEAFSHGYRLPAAVIRKLGKVPDAKLRDQYGIPSTVLHRAREARAIPKFSRRKKKDLTKKPLSGPEKDVSTPDGTLFGVSCVKKADSKRRASVCPTSHPQAESWYAEWLELLGQIPDKDLAARTGGLLNIRAVRDLRLKCRIPVCREQKLQRGNWTAELIELLGKIPDKELAKKSGGLLSLENVRKTRIKRKIPVCPEPKKNSGGGRASRPDVVALMGKISDYEISKITGVQRSEIARHRKMIGIPALSRGRPLREWLPEEDQMLGTLADYKVAEALRMSPVSVRKRRVALGISRVAVCAPDRTKPSPLLTAEIMPESRWSKDEDSILGTMVDSKAAAILKRDFWDVYQRRKELQIAAYEFAYS